MVFTPVSESDTKIKAALVRRADDSAVVPKKVIKLSESDPKALSEKDLVESEQQDNGKSWFLLNY